MLLHELMNILSNTNQTELNLRDVCRNCFQERCKS
ncbi:hypothetical protein X946_5561 [Burkholderia sp. ABCPW 111]|nr:hypothetical protein X946_5561 [Burkholderia sp. ABCPW 111]